MVKFSVLFLTLLTGMYFLMLGNTAIVLVQQDSPIAKVMGVFLLVLPAIALWAVISEMRFGFRSEKLAKEVEAEGSWPTLAKDFLPSGRPVKASALELFEDFKRKTEVEPNNWRVWFNLGLSYDACGDRKRAREALRKALALKAQEKTAA